MASTAKKRKADQDPNHDTNPKPLLTPVAYIRQPDQDQDSDPDYNDNDEEQQQDIAKLLSPLDTPQLISLLLSASARDPLTLASIRSLSDLDPSHRNLFIHSLGCETNSETLRSAFSPYGEIEESRVVADRATGRSKGYGFVLFKNRSSARRALRKPNKLIDNRMTTCQLASNGPSQNSVRSNQSPGDNLLRKIYVGNVHGDIDGRRLRDFFARFGEIEEGPIGFDRQTGKAKGFALFVFRTAEGARKALEEPNKSFEGCDLVCQKATDGNKGRVSVSGNNGGGASNGFDAAGYGGQINGLGMGAALLGQGFVGQGMPVNAALLAMLAAAGQNPAAFGVNPAMLASLNPALMGALGTGVSPTAVTPAAMQQQAGSVPNFALGSSGYQNVGFQGPAGFQGPPGFQGAPGFQGTPPPGAQQVGGGGSSSYQGGNFAQAGMQRSAMGPMSGYGLH